VNLANRNDKAETALPLTFRLLGYRVDVQRNAVIAPSGERPLEPKVMQVLCALAERQGSVVTRDDLIALVWAKSFGADESLTRAVSILRRTFDDARDSPALIETVPKRGYRLIPPVEPEPPQGPTPLPEQAHRGATNIWAAIVLCICLILLATATFFDHRSKDRQSTLGSKPTPLGVTVLLRPFTASPTDATNVRLADALSRQLAAGLARASLLRVMASAPGPSLIQGTGEGSSFQVDATVTDRDTGIRVAVAIRDGANGRLLWAQDFDRNLPLGAAGLDALGSAITAELSNRLLIAAKTAIRQRPFASLHPWELNLLATWVPGSDEVFLRPHQADRFRPQHRALQLDPGYAPAHATWASQLSYDALFNAEGPSSQSRQQAGEHVEKALALAPYDPDVLYAVATYYRQIGARAQAIATLDRVLAVQPDHPLAALDRAYDQGLCTATAATSIRHLERDLDGLAEDNPIRWVVLSHLADLYLGMGEPARAASIAARSREIVQSTWNGFTLAVSRAASGDPVGATEASGELRREWPKLDYEAFSKHSLQAWCLNGPDQTFVRSALGRAANQR